jgi:hypothetical protein
MAKNTDPNPASQTTNAAAPTLNYNQDDFLNVAAKLPQYDGLDARDGKNVGKFGPEIHGLLLGTIELPSTQKDAKGNTNPWVAVVVELKSPCPVKEGNVKDGITTRLASPGERIIFTVTKAFNRFAAIADDAKYVHEVVIGPKVSRTREGRSLVEFPKVLISRKPPVARDARIHMVGVADIVGELESDKEAAIAALPVGNGGASASA